MKHLISVLSVLFLCAISSVRAAEPPALSGSLGLDYVSIYVFRGVESAADSWQPSVNLAYGDTYFNIWASGPLGHRLTETDLTLGTALAGFDVGITAYTYQGSTDTWEPYIGLSKDVGSRLNLSAYTFYDAQLRVFTFEGRESIKVYTIGALGLTMDGDVGHANGRDTSYTYWAVGPTLKWSVSKRVTLTAAVQYTSAEIKPSHWIAHIGSSLSF